MRYVFLLFFIFSFLSFSATNIWRIEAESEYVKFQKGVEIIEDKEASGGKVLKVPSENVPTWNVVYFSFPFKGESGIYELKVKYKYENAADIGKGWRIDIREANVISEYGVIYGYNLKEQKGYKDYTITFLWKKPENPPGIYMRWLGVEGKPVIYLDYFEFEKKAPLPPLIIKEVFPNKIRYLPNESGNVKVSIENLTDEMKKGKLRVELINNLDDRELIGERSIDIYPKSIKELNFEFKIKQLYGHSVKAILFIGDKIVDEKEEFFTVHKNPWAVAVCGARDEAIKEYYPIWHHVFYNIGATDPLIEQCALNARKEYTTCTEFFSWSPGEPFYMAPEEPIWIRGNGGNLLRSKREIQKEVSELKKYGIACITYLALQAMGEKTIEILQKKPEWFAYSSSTGDLIEFYRVSELEKQREFWKKFNWEEYKKFADPTSKDWENTEERWKKYTEFWKPYIEEVRKFSTIGYFVPNYKLPEVVDYVADQVILSTKIFGWDGLRWDCGHLNTGPLWGPYTPWVDFYGKVLAETKEEMEKQTIENLKRFKDRIRRVFPDFVFGTNFGSKEETRKFPEMTKEFCKDGSWLLDEVSYTYNRPTSPYHTWKNYYKIMTEQGDYVMSLGGHYNPFSFNRSGGKFPVDRLYGSIFAIVGKGHPNTLYYDSKTNCGNFAQFLVRFGKFTFGEGLKRIKNPQKIIKVNSEREIWWEESVNLLEEKRREYIIVNLINPPVAEEIETDPMSTLPSPLKDVKVELIKKGNYKKIRTFIVKAEALSLKEKPKTEAVEIPYKIIDGKIVVEIPEILYWKMLVFEFQK